MWSLQLIMELVALLLVALLLLFFLPHYSNCIMTIFSVVLSWVLYRLWLFHGHFRSPNNLSLYDSRHFQTFSPRQHFFMKKANFTTNRYYWRATDLNLFFYTSNCNEAATISSFYKRSNCHFRIRSRSLDYFVEAAFVSYFLNEDDELIDKLIDQSHVTWKTIDDQAEITVCYDYSVADDSTAQEFFTESPTSKKQPDILLKITTKDETQKFIIDIKNKKKPTGVNHKYDKLCKGAVVFSLCTGMVDDHFQWTVSSVPPQPQLPQLFLDYFGSVFENDFATRYGTDSCSYNEDRKYWNSCFYQKKILKTQSRKSSAKLAVFSLC